MADQTIYNVWTTVGVLTEVSVMLMLVRIANKTKGRFSMTVREKAETDCKRNKERTGNKIRLLFLSRLQRRNISAFMDRNTIY